MDRKLTAVRNALSELEQLQRAIGGDSIDSSDVLTNKLGRFVDTLSTMFEEGRSMDESSMIQLPMDLFDHLDNPAANNPELFQVKMIEDAENRAVGLKKKFSDLDELRTSVEAAVDTNSS
eukprot:gene20200-22953_t